MRYSAALAVALMSAASGAALATQQHIIPSYEIQERFGNLASIREAKSSKRRRSRYAVRGW